VYSLGMIAYEMLAGHLPFEAPSLKPTTSPEARRLPSIREQRPAIRAAVDAILARATSPVPADRYRSAGDFAGDLRQAVSTASGEGKATPERRPAARAKQALGFTTLVVLTVYLALFERAPRSVPRPKRPAPNPEALRYLTEGAAWRDKYPFSAINAESSFRKAIRVDSTFADAYAALSQFYVARAIGNYGDVEPKSYFLEARKLAERALELDSVSAEAHAAHAIVMMFDDFDWSGAEREFNRSFELDSASLNAWIFYPVWLQYVGRFHDAVAQARKAVQVQPLSEVLKAELGRVLFLDRDFDGAAETLRDELLHDSTQIRVHLVLGQVYQQQGMSDSAISHLRTAIRLKPDASRAHALVAELYALAGRPREAQQELRGLKEIARHGYVGALNLAIAYAGARNEDSTFAWLERALDDRSMRPYLFDPTFDFIRDDPRYEQILHRMHLPYRPAAR